MLFDIKGRNTTVRREILAGVTSFFTVAYLLVLIPTLIAPEGMQFDQIVTAVALAGCIGCVFLGLFANYPFVLAPGAAMAAYLGYAVVDQVPWASAMGMVFLVGATLLIFNLLRIRVLIVETIPHALRVGVTAGLGLFLAFIALKNVGLKAPVLSVPHVMMALGLLITAVLMVLRVVGAPLIGILVIWLISVLAGFTPWKGLFALPMPPEFLELDVRGGATQLSLFLSLLIVALFDSTGALIGLTEKGGYVEQCEERKCHIPQVQRVFTCDSVSSMFAGMMGSSPTSFCIESVIGMATGGKTGIVAMTTGILFLLALFFAPFLASIPHFAVAPILLIIGGMMTMELRRIDWSDISAWIPGFATMVLIPFTFSIVDGVSFGYIIYCLIKLILGRVKEVHWMTWLIAALFLIRFFFPML